MTPSTDSVRADAELAIRPKPEIYQGETCDGMSWVVVIHEKFGELRFAYNGLVRDFLSREHARAIASALPSTTFPDVPHLIDDIVYVD